MFVLLVKVNPFTVSELFTPSSDRVCVTIGRFAGRVTLSGIATLVPTSMEESTVKSVTLAFAVELVKVTELPLAVPVLQFERDPVNVKGDESTVKSVTFASAVVLVKVTELPLAVPALQFERDPVKVPIVVVPLLIAVPVWPEVILANALATVEAVIAELALSVSPAIVIDSPAMRDLNVIWLDSVRLLVPSIFVTKLLRVWPEAILANALATVEAVIAELAFSVKPATVIDSPAMSDLNTIWLDSVTLLVAPFTPLVAPSVFVSVIPGSRSRLGVPIGR